MDFDFDRIIKSPFLIGAAGALVTALRYTPGSSWWEKAVNVAAGALAAGYLTPVITQWLHMVSEGYTNGAAFLIGLLGMSVADSVLKGIQNLNVADIIVSWAKRKD